MKLSSATRYRLFTVWEYALLFQALTILFYLIHLLSILHPAEGLIFPDVDSRLWLALFPGMLVGFADEFFVRRWFRNLPFLLALFIRTAIHSVILTLALLVVTYLFAIFNVPEGQDTSPGELLLSRFITWREFWRLTSYYTLQVLLALSIVQLKKYVGRGRLLSFLTGQYTHPVWENNLLMFVDLKASTTIAEALNSKIFSEFIRDFIYDISKPIFEFDGRIYQYVGDEVVVYWKMSKDKEANTRAIRCFVGMMDAINERKDYYVETYGVMPQFKAGLHGGPLIVAEVGELKKEIAFHGTVINTTARIQKKCNDLNTNFLLSDYVLEHAELAPDFVPFSEGSFLLKGKAEEVELFTVEKASNLLPVQQAQKSDT